MRGLLTVRPSPLSPSDLPFLYRLDLLFSPPPPPLSHFFITLSYASSEASDGRTYSSSDDNDDGEDGGGLPDKFVDIVRKCSECGRASPPMEPEPGARPSSQHPAAYNALMKAFSRAGKVDEILRLLREMKEEPPPPLPLRRRGSPGVLCYNTAMNALVDNARGIHEVGEVFEEMAASGVSTTAATYNILLRAPSSSGFAHKVLELMFQSGCRPDETTYSTLIARLCAEGRVDDAYGILYSMLSEGGLRPNVYSYTPILQALCSRGRVEEAKSLLKMMEDNGCPPNTVAHNILIGGLCKEWDFDGVETLLRESAAKGWRPNVITYSTYMAGLCKAGKAREAFSQLDNMWETGLHPSAVTLNILLDCLCRDSKHYEAKSLLERSRELGWDVTVVNYNSVMSAFSEKRGWLVVVHLFTGMLKKGVTPNTRTYNIVIHSLCLAENVGKAKRIKNSGLFVPDCVTYNILIDGFFGVGKEPEVEHLVRSMVEEDIYHDLFTYTIRIDRLCKLGKAGEAYQLFRILKQHLSPDLFLYSVLISGLVKNRELNVGRSLVKEMMGNGMVPNARTFNSLISAFCSQGFCRSREINHIVDKMFRKYPHL